MDPIVTANHPHRRLRRCSPEGMTRDGCRTRVRINYVHVRLSLDLHPEPGHPGAVVAAVHEAIDGVVVDGLRPDQYAGAIAELARARSRLHALELELVAAAEKARVADGRRVRVHGGVALAADPLRRRGRRADGEAGHRPPRPAPGHHRRAVRGCRVPRARGGDRPRHLPAPGRAHRRAEGHRGSDAGREGAAGRPGPAAAARPPGAGRGRGRRLGRRRPRGRPAAGRGSGRARPDPATLHDHGDGTTSGHLTVPTLAGLDPAQGPRRDDRAPPQPARRHPRPGRRGRRTATPRASSDRGLAFTDLLEHLPTDRLHGKVAATVVVTLDLDTLRGRLRPPASTPATSSPPPKPAGSPARRDWSPPCSTAVPVLLDLGRSRRLFTEAQRVAGATRHTRLRRPRLQGPVRLVRAPPPTYPGARRPDRPGRHGAAVRVPPPPDPRPRPTCTNGTDPTARSASPVGHEPVVPVRRG